MHRLTLVLLLALSFSSAGFSAVQADTAQPNHVVILRRRIVLMRSADLAKKFPHKRRAVVTYPVISGLSPAVLRRVRAVLDFKNIFDYSLKEYREDVWLSEFGYVVNYNRNYLLDITFTQDGSGAYPDSHSKHFLINLRDGSVVKASDAFEFARLAELVALIDRKLQLELEQIEKENTDPNEAPDEKAARQEAQEVLKFGVKDLDDFSVGTKGITFLYDAGFPHAIQASEPQGRYFFSYSELRRFIKPDGPLGQFVR